MRAILHITFLIGGTIRSREIALSKLLSRSISVIQNNPKLALKSFQGIVYPWREEFFLADLQARQAIQDDCTAAFKFCLSWSKIFHKARFQLAKLCQDPKAAVQEMRPLFSKGRKLFDIHVDYIQDADDMVRFCHQFKLKLNDLHIELTSASHFYVC